jgi:uncharacterized protein DUF3108
MISRPVRLTPAARTFPALALATLAFATLAFAALPSQARAQGQAGSPPGVAQTARTIRLSYVLFGHGFHVMDVSVEFRLAPHSYSMRLNDHTVGLLGFMAHTDVTSTATGRFVAGGVQPVHFESSGYSRGAQRDTVLDYVDGNPVVRVLTPREPRRDPVDPAQTRGSIDTLSAMADMVHLVQEGGRCDGHALVFDGLRLSQVSSQTAGQQVVPPDSRSPYGGPALRCDFVSLEIGGFLHNADEARMRKPQHGSAWVERLVQGAPLLPVRITFEHPALGQATMFLTKVEEIPASPTGG